MNAKPWNMPCARRERNSAEANRALQKMASEDSLTQIANRRMFLAWFES